MGQEISEDKCRVISYGESHLSVNEYTYSIISLIDEGASNDIIKAELLKLYGSEEVDENIDLVRARLTALKSKKKKGKKYLFFNIKIFSFKEKNIFLGALAVLYKKWIAYIILLALLTYIIANYKIFFLDYNGLALEISSSPYLTIIYFVATIGILIIHEFGHASALYAFGLIPKEICFGIYMYFPVFYTDVSGAWMLDKKKRIVVDCGGFYFQIILSAILILACKLTGKDSLLLKVLLWDNLFMILYNLNPLFRFDGYWLFSDFLDAPNLRPRSMMAVSDLLARLSSEKYRNNKRVLSFSYYFYGIISVVFILATCCLFWSIFVRNIINDLATFSAADAFALIKLMAKYIMFLAFVYISSRTIYSTFLNLIRNAIQLRKES